MKKSEIRKALWDFFFEKPKGKWEVIDRRWRQLNLTAYDLLLWVCGFFTGQVWTVLTIHLLVLLALLILYWAAKGR